MCPPFENIERIGRDGVHLMIRSVHHEIDAGGDLAELSDNQLVSIESIVVGHMFLEIRIAEICEVADYDVGMPDRRLYIGDCLAAGNGEYGIRVGFHDRRFTGYVVRSCKSIYKSIYKCSNAVVRFGGTEISGRIFLFRPAVVRNRRTCYGIDPFPPVSEGSGGTEGPRQGRFKYVITVRRLSGGQWRFVFFVESSLWQRMFGMVAVLAGSDIRDR